MKNEDLKILRNKIKVYLWSRGSKGDEDMEQQMLLHALERGDQPIDISILFFKALDDLKPRDRNVKGWRPKDACENVRDVTRESGEIIPVEEMNNLIDFSAVNIKERRAMKKKMNASKYLARMRFGHLPFIV